MLLDFSLYKLPFDLRESWEPEAPSPSPTCQAGFMRASRCVRTPPSFGCQGLACVLGRTCCPSGWTQPEAWSGTHTLRLPAHGLPVPLGPPFLATPKRRPHLCPGPALPASLRGLTHTHASRDRPPKPSPEPLTRVSLPRCHPVCHIPYIPLSSACPPDLKPLLVCWGWPSTVPGSQGSGPHSSLLLPESPDCVPLPLPRVWTQASVLSHLDPQPSPRPPGRQAVPTPSPRGLSEPRTDLWPPPPPPAPAVLDRVQPSATPCGLAGTHPHHLSVTTALRGFHVSLRVLSGSGMAPFPPTGPLEPATPGSLIFPWPLKIPLKTLPPPSTGSAGGGVLPVLLGLPPSLRASAWLQQHRPDPEVGPGSRVNG
ncbi:vegetative cell wall protein gp1-like [Herpailurus yagouaroundi]|uniref:vegetative cell wall protein gp1-like n=1 Tax=Herpailurus yagouaroundi TaxID=1608482 RepID=UPI001AD7022B|nr:vegetative cell wall protein gp1-like [Puma yagouaroundi]XP_040314031.1 vegetative cell wall protein gp1-like [Puma yagouaroundi]